MRDFKSASIGLVAMVAIAGLSVQAEAATQTQTFTIATSAVGGSGFPQSFSLALFDPSLGTLQSVDFAVTATGTAQLNVTNTSGSTVESYSASGDLPITITGTGPSSTNFTVNVNTGLQAGNVNAGQTLHLTGLPASGSSDTGALTTGSVLSAYTSTTPGTVQTASVSASAPSGTTQGTGGPDVLFGTSGNVGGTMSVTYTYIAASGSAPEPGALALAIPGILGVVGMGIRRRRSSK